MPCGLARSLWSVTVIAVVFQIMEMLFWPADRQCGAMAYTRVINVVFLFGSVGVNYF
jgi:hypothetical protein